jgi:hypothetical protein
MKGGRNGCSCVLAGIAAGDGFLIAPVGPTFPAELLLWTDAGTASVMLQASPKLAGLVFSQAVLNLDGSDERDGARDRAEQRAAGHHHPAGLHPL